LFSTNGCFIADKNNQPVNNGDNLSPGEIYDGYCPTSYPAHKSNFFLPSLSDSTQFFLFHLGIEYLDTIVGSAGNKWYYTLLQHTDQEDKVILKNQVLLEDTLCWGQIAANRHANGRDWWIIVPEFARNRHYVFLLTPNGIAFHHEQSIGNISKDDSGSGTAIFSPDGARYARFDLYNGLNIFDFDRCTGWLSNAVYEPYIQLGPDSISRSGSCAISSSSRFLYTNDNYRVWQYDLFSTNLWSSKTLIAVYDGFEEPPVSTGTYFFAFQLAPDGKLYLSCANAVSYMHVIDHPNEQGTACGIRQHGITLPAYNVSAMPYFPNYRLGALPGSPCDTISSVQEIGAAAPLFKVYPTLAQQYIVVERESGDAAAPTGIRITDGYGRLQYTGELSNYQAFERIEVANWPAGVYFVVLEQKGRPVFLGRIVKMPE
jgi:hypothetical protein